jgi:competence protein ComEC
MNARLLPLLGLLLAVACKEPAKPPAATTSPTPARPTSGSKARFLAGPPDGKLHVYFFDVGQGDAALIISPEGRTVLVDTGPASAVPHMANRLPELLAARLDLIVLTHPAPDHYGALQGVQQIAEPRRLLEPQLPSTSKEYDAVLMALGSKGVEILSPAPNPSQPQEPLRLPLGGGAELTVLWPRAPSEPLLTAAADPGAAHEANSIVLRLTHGETSVLFAGDARAETEAELVKQRGPALRSTLLKVSAHGAETATSLEWLQEVRPVAAIISSGASNPQGLPATATLERLKAAEAQVFRTDQHGEVHVVSDGKRFTLTTQRTVPGEPTTGPRIIEPQAEDLVFKPLVTPEPAPVAKAVPAKAVSAKSPEPADLSRFKQVVEMDQLGTPKAMDKGGRTGKGATKAGTGRYVGSSRSDVFHVPDCRNARRISPENVVWFSTREAAAKDRRPAKDCNP